MCFLENSPCMIFLWRTPAKVWSSLKLFALTDLEPSTPKKFQSLLWEEYGYFLGLHNERQEFLISHVQKQHTLQNCVLYDFANQRCWYILWQSYSEFDEVLRIRREVDKKIGEITSAVQVHSSLSWVYIIPLWQ